MVDKALRDTSCMYINTVYTKCSQMTYEKAENGHQFNGKNKYLLMKLTYILAQNILIS
jgi:hypothetical protein